MSDDVKRRPASPAGWKAAASRQDRRGQRYGWKVQNDAPVGRSSRRLRQVFIVLGAIACVAVIVVLIKLLQRPHGAGLALVGADPAADFDRLDVPLDPFGWQGGHRLAEWAKRIAETEQSRWGKLTPDVIGGDVASYKADGFAKWATQLADLKADPLIVYFGLLGGADSTGPYLIAASGTRLDLKLVLETFAGEQFRDRQVVLLFDPARNAAEPQLGRLYNDCVRSLEALEPVVQMALSKLVVICASAPAQRSWDSEEWRASAFTQALLDGLRGAAAPGRTEVTAWDLFDYANVQTAKWTGANRPTRQTPIMLPKPDSGGRDRATKIQIGVKNGDVPPSDPETAPGKTFTASDELIARWKKCDDLAKAVPSPAAYTPRLWRRYRELLLRYERLSRAGEPVAAKLGQLLQDMETEIKDGRLVGRDLKSRGNSIPLAFAFDGTDNFEWTDAQKATFRKLLETTNEAERKAQIDAIRIAADGPKLVAFLLQRAADPARTGEEIALAADLLSAIADSDRGAPRPAEAHFLLMVRAFFKEAGEKLPPALLHLAIETRLLAEQAAIGVQPSSGAQTVYPYSEQVTPIERVRAADELRRLGEDLLFASPAQWPDAKTNLTEAKNRYREILDLERIRRDALAIRNECCADLPLLDRWRGAKRYDSALIADFEGVWEKLDALDAILSAPTPQPNPAVATESLRNSLASVRERFQSAVQAAIPESSILQQNWQRIEDLLAVPLIESKLRRQLLDQSRKISSRLNSETAIPKDATSAESEAPSRDAARWQARLAIAELYGPDDKAGVALRVQSDFPPTEWQTAANRIGEELASGWRQLLVASDDADKNERASRSAVAFGAIPGPEPATLNRTKRWQRLFTDLARRTTTDHWYSESIRDVPYFRTAAKRFRDDAVAVSPTPIADLDALDKLINTTSLRLEGPPTLDWTSEPTRDLSFSVVAPSGFPSGGRAVLWPTPPPEPVRLSPDELPRQPLVIATDGAARRLRFSAPPNAETKTGIAVRMNGYFRGQPLESTTQIRFERTPVTIYRRYDPPVEARFAVRANDDLLLGAIAIVLDFSGSMADVAGKDPDWINPASKVKQELKALETVLKNLPRGTPISIRIFGDKNNKPPDIPPGIKVEEKEAYQTSRTLSHAITPKNSKVTWSAENLEPLRSLMDGLGTYQPYYGTPLVASMKEAAAKDFPEKFQGAKLLLVLTDGMDTSYPLAKGRVAGVRKEFEEAFGSADISVQMVLFRVDPSEEKTAKEQFEESLKKLKTASHLWEAKNPEDLAVALESALRPRVRLLDNGKPVDKASVPEAGLPANRERDDLLKLVPSGLIKPGSFEAVVSGSEPQAMKLARGDRLLVRLLSDAQERVVYRRDLFANEFHFLTDRRKDEGEWVLCVPQLTDELTSFFTRLRLMATVETTRGQIPTRKGILQQSPPAYVLWEVVPGGPDEPKMGQMRVESLPGYPAPAWKVVVDDWPTLPVRPVRLTAYVGRELPSGKPMPIPIDRVLAGGYSTKDAKVDGHDVSLSVSYEEQPLRTAANQTDEPPRVPCLVVRVTHPLNQPVTVHLGALKTIGEEHRFYKAAGAYTGLFGPLTREELAGLKLELSLLSLAELKAAATPIRIDMIPRRGELAPETLDPLRSEKGK